MAKVTNMENKSKLNTGNIKTPFNKPKKENEKELKSNAELYKRVGTQFYLYTSVPTAKGKMVKILKKWTKSTIKDDHGSGIFKYIEKFIDFVNIPDNTEKYKRELDGCFNLYEPIPYKPKQGEFPVTENFIKHIFGKYFEVGLDYLQLLFLKPTQNLPILCLVSKKQKTGKTTFLKWLCNIYGDNSVILGNEDFASNFNAHWINKLIIGVDESFIEKKILKEKIKRLATDDKALQENKGLDKVTRDFIGKIILLSNNEKNFIQMDEEDNRFFVLKIPDVLKEDPDLDKKLEKEIPAFLYYLSQRKLKHKKESRLWFSPDKYITEEFKSVVNNTRNIIEKSLIDYLSDLADNLRDMDDSNEVDSINIVPARLAEAIKPTIGNISGLNIKIGDILKNDWGLKPTEHPERFSYPYFIEIDAIHPSYGNNQEGYEKERVIRFFNQTGRYYKIPFTLIDEKFSK